MHTSYILAEVVLVHGNKSTSYMTSLLTIVKPISILLHAFACCSSTPNSLLFLSTSALCQFLLHFLRPVLYFLQCLAA